MIRKVCKVCSSAWTGQRVISYHLDACNLPQDKNAVAVEAKLRLKEVKSTEDILAQVEGEEEKVLG
eukprot:455444-Hanusia_phi.AAC.1